MSPFDELTPPYSTIVADPPWAYPEGLPHNWAPDKARDPLPYSSLDVDAIAAMPVADLAAPDAHLWLWTTNRYLRDAYGVLDGWGFRFSQLIVWCKPIMGVGPGGAFSNTTEYVLFGRRGKLAHLHRVPSTWFQWPRGAHSVKPAAFGDLVEQVSPGPYVELFARSPRLGWDSWGHGYEGAA